MAGSIEKRNGNSYRLVVSAGRGLDGKRKKYTKTITIDGKTETEINKKADKELSKFIVEVEKDDYTEPSKLTFEAFSAMWLKNYAKPNLALKTSYEYEKLLEKRIIPAIGHLKISNIKPLQLVNFFNNLQEDGMREDRKKGKLSNNTLLHYYRLLSVMLNTALKWQLISSNPVRNVDPPKLEDKEGKSYDEAEVLLLIEKLQHENLDRQVAILLALAGGLRTGEVTGLKWENINFDENEIYILKTTQYIPKTTVFEKQPKNKTSKRLISIPSSVMDLVKILQTDQNYKRESCGDLWHSTDYIFTAWNGNPIHPQTPGKWFDKIIKKYNLRKITYHQLRHTSATLLINEGENVKTLSSRLGHAETSTTMNIYVHALKSADKSAANKLENLMFKK